MLGKIICSALYDVKIKNTCRTFSPFPSIIQALKTPLFLEIIICFIFDERHWKKFVPCLSSIVSVALRRRVLYIIFFFYIIVLKVIYVTSTLRRLRKSWNTFMCVCESLNADIRYGRGGERGSQRERERVMVFE